MGPPTAPRMEVSRTMVADHFGEGDGPHWRQHSDTPAVPSRRPRIVSGGDNSQSIREEACRNSRTLSQAAEAHARASPKPCASTTLTCAPGSLFHKTHGAAVEQTETVLTNAVNGVISEGFMTIVQPHARAGATFHDLQRIVESIID